MSESKHASRLRERGFIERPAEEQAYLERRFELRLASMGATIDNVRLDRNQRRRLKKALNKPMFIFLLGWTLVRDDTSYWWSKQAIEDLSALGFTNASGHIPEALALPPLEIASKTH